MWRTAIPGQPSPQASAGPDWNFEGAERHFEGAVLVADVAGYTALADGLSSARPDGIEFLGKLLKGNFLMQSAVVDHHGGSISSLAGDAIVAFWPLTSNGIEDSAKLASACAGDLLGATSSDGLSIHIGLSAGQLWAGMSEGWQTELVLGGPAVRQAFELAKSAPPGQALAPRHVHRMLQRGARDVATSAAPLPLGDLLEPSRYRRGRSAESIDPWIGELRSVSALFLRLLDFDELQPDNWQRFKRALLLIRELAGSSNAAGRLVVDENGLVCVSVLGEPTGATLGAPDIVVHRAASLVKALERAGFPVAAGLAFGRAFCGHLGARSQSALITVGRVMNLAARLMDTAGRGLLVADLPTARWPAEWRAIQTTGLRLRGFHGEIEVLRPPLDVAVLQRPLLFGREEELLRLQRMLAGAREGNGCVCMLRADAGMGKSTLLAALEALAVEAGVTVATGHSREAERTVAFFPWRGVMRGLFPAWEHQEDAQLRNSLSAYLSELGQPSELAPLLNAVFYAGFPETERSAALTGKNRAEATLDLLLEMVRAAAARPIVIAFEDVHLADSASLDLLERVGQHIRNALLVLTARPTPKTSELIYRLAGPRYQQVDLRTLERGAIASLISARSGQAAIDVSLLDAVEEASEGNPLFVLEYLLLLREGGRVAQREGRIALVHPDAKMGAPQTVLDAVSSRIHALPTDEQQVLKLASVLYGSFTRSTIQEMGQSAMSGWDVGGALRNLERSGLLVQQSMRADSFGFSHEVVRQAAYDLMLIEQRNRAHSDVARILEQQYERDRNTLLPLLVHHHVAAGDDRGIISFGDKAAANALQHGAFREAAEFLTLCVDAARRNPDWDDLSERCVRWNRQLSEAMGALGDLEGRRTYALAAVTFSGKLVLRSQLVAKVHIVFGLLRRVFSKTPGHRTTPQRRASGAIDRELAKAFHQISMANYYFMDSRVWFPHYILRALSHAERAGRSPELASVLASAGACIGYLGLQRTARRYLAASSAMAAAMGDDQALAFADMVSALHHVHVGSWRDASRRIRRCQRIAHRIGDKRVWGEAQTIHVWVALYRGDIDTAFEAAQALKLAAERSNNRQHLWLSHRFLGICHRRRADSERAIACLEIARTLFGAHEHMTEATLASGVLSGVLSGVGRIHEAEALAFPLIERMKSERYPTSHALIEGCSGLAEVALRSLRLSQGRDRARRSMARDAIETLARIASTFPIGLPRYHALHGDLLECIGKSAAARKSWQRGRQAATRLEMAYEPGIFQA